MKKLLYLVSIIGMMIFLAFGCSDPVNNVQDDNGDDNVDAVPRILVHDSSETFVGYLVSENFGAYRILTPGGYLVSVTVAGELCAGLHSFNFTEENYTGDAYVNRPEGEDFWFEQSSKQFFIFWPDWPTGSTEIYEPIDADNAGYVTLETHTINVKSYYDVSDNSREASCDYPDIEIVGIQVQESTHADATMLLGLTGPLTLSIDE